MPGEPSEPTSTIVLTSPKNHFVDIRIFKQTHNHEGDEEILPVSSLDWAFAGQSRSFTLPLRPGQSQAQSHTVWAHWIDSRTNQPDVDEGDMTELSDGTVLEQGSTRDKSSGLESRYEELWMDLPIESVSAGQDRECIVLLAKQDHGRYQGMVIKLGSWCQAILKTDTGLTIERWQALPLQHDGSLQGPSSECPALVRPRQWSRCFKIGRHDLPCSLICQEMRPSQLSDFWNVAGVHWEVVEKQYW